MSGVRVQLFQVNKIRALRRQPRIVCSRKPHIVHTASVVEQTPSKVNVSRNKAIVLPAVVGPTLMYFGASLVGGYVARNFAMGWFSTPPTGDEQLFIAVIGPVVGTSLAAFFGLWTVKRQAEEQALAKMQAEEKAVEEALAKTMIMVTVRVQDKNGVTIASAPLTPCPAQFLRDSCGNDPYKFKSYLVLLARKTIPDYTLIDRPETKQQLVAALAQLDQARLCLVLDCALGPILLELMLDKELQPSLSTLLRRWQRYALVLDV